MIYLDVNQVGCVLLEKDVDLVNDTGGQGHVFTVWIRNGVTGNGCVWECVKHLEYPCTRGENLEIAVRVGAAV